MCTGDTNNSSIREHLFLQMARIRIFEEQAFELFAAGELSGTMHACIGQEAIAVAAAESLRTTDIVISNHRCHGHYLARTGDMAGLLAELMGKQQGLCGGRGGSQHLAADNFYTNGVQGNMVPVAAGMALAEKVTNSGNIITLFVGDGTLGQGVFYETLNIAALWSLPLLIVVENNQYAQTTHISDNLAGNISARAAAFGINSRETPANDVEFLLEPFRTAIDYVRNNNIPFVLVAETYRLCPHSVRDDHRPAAELEKWQTHDPLTILGNRIALNRMTELRHTARVDMQAATAAVRQMTAAVMEKTR